MILTKPEILMRLCSSAVLSGGTEMAQSTAQREKVLFKRSAQMRGKRDESSRSMLSLALRMSEVR